jgi:hypothetical protein
MKRWLIILLFSPIFALGQSPGTFSDIYLPPKQIPSNISDKIYPDLNHHLYWNGSRLDTINAGSSLLSNVLNYLQVCAKDSGSKYITPHWLSLQGYVTGTPWTGMGYLTSNGLPNVTNYLQVQLKDSLATAHGYITPTALAGKNYLTNNGLGNVVNYLQVKVADSNKTIPGNYVTRKRDDSIAALKAPIANPTFTGKVGNSSYHKITADSAVLAGYKALGNSSTAITIYASQSNMFGITRTGSCTVTLFGMVAGQTIKIIFTHEASASAYTVAFSPTVKWPGGTALTFTNTSGAIDVVAIFYDGGNYYATGLAAFN